MKNPNQFRVTYEVIEGDNYAGGWVTHTAYVNELGDVQRFQNIKTVEPVFMEVGEPLTGLEIKNAAIQRAKENDKQTKVNTIARAQRILDEAKADLTS